jgi:ATP-dependent DNA ligase
MHATPVDQLPAPDAFGGAVYEMKWDGWRVLLFASPGRVYLQSRSGKPLCRYFPDVVAYARDVFPPGAVADAELIVWDPRHGRTSFTLLQQRLTAGRAITGEAAAHPASLVLFDLLHDGTRPLIDQPLWARRQRLAQLLSGAPPQMLLCPQTDDPDLARAWLRDLPTVGVEGLVIKARTGRYRPGHRGWAKLRARHSTEAILAGVTGSLDDPHSLLLGRLDTAGRLRYAGHTTPLSHSQRRQLALLLRDLPEQAADHPWPTPLPVSWTGQFRHPQPLAYQPVPAQLVVEISADIAYEHGRWRHRPRFIRARPDLTTAQVPPHRHA